MLWRQEMVSMGERRIAVYELVPGMVLESVDDVAPLVILPMLAPYFARYAVILAWRSNDVDDAESDIGQATMGLIRKLQGYKPDMIKMELEKLKQQLNKDLE